MSISSSLAKRLKPGSLLQDRYLIQSVYFHRDRLIADAVDQRFHINSRRLLLLADSVQQPGSPELTLLRNSRSRFWCSLVSDFRFEAFIVVVLAHREFLPLFCSIDGGLSAAEVDRRMGSLLKGMDTIWEEGFTLPRFTLSGAMWTSDDCALLWDLSSLTPISDSSLLESARALVVLLEKGLLEHGLSKPQLMTEKLTAVVARILLLFGQTVSASRCQLQLYDHWNGQRACLSCGEACNDSGLLCENCAAGNGSQRLALSHAVLEMASAFIRDDPVSLLATLNKPVVQNAPESLFRGPVRYLLEHPRLPNLLESSEPRPSAPALVVEALYRDFPERFLEFSGSIQQGTKDLRVARMIFRSLKDENPEQCEKLLLHVMGPVPITDPQFDTWLAYLAIGRGDLSKASRLLKRAIGASRPPEQAFALLSDLILDGADLEEARQVLERGLALFPESTSLLDRFATIAIDDKANWPFLQKRLESQIEAGSPSRGHLMAYCAICMESERWTLLRDLTRSHLDALGPLGTVVSYLLCSPDDPSPADLMDLQRSFRSFRDNPAERTLALAALREFSRRGVDLDLLTDLQLRDDSPPAQPAEDTP
jgi:hypothetical protein